jgi:VWFA-related protein
MGRWRSGSRGRWIAVAVLLGVMVGLRAGAAQQAETTAQTASVPTIKVTARETVVDVTVTDAKGNPVHGLRRADFTVKEDGKVQPIRSFDEFGRSTPEPTTQAPPKLPPNVYSNQQATAASSAVNILLLDFVNSAAIPDSAVIGAGDALGRAFAAQRQIKLEAMKYVATMPAGTRVIVLGLSKSLRTLQGSTSDPALLSAAIEPMALDPEGHASTYEQFCSQTDVRLRGTMEALRQIAADASEIKGKKNLLWFSVGLPWLTDPADRPECLASYSGDMLKTFGLLTAAQIAVYPIDVFGVQTLPGAFFTSMGHLWENVHALPAPAYIAAQQAFQQELAVEHLAMESWAEATGGYAYYNSNDLAGLIAQAVDKGGNYYTLTYVPPGTKYNYAHHSIKVSVDQPGLHLVYRESYDAVDPATIKPAVGLTLATIAPEVVDGNMRAAMSRSMPTSEQIIFDVRVEPSAVTAKAGDPPVMGTLDARFKDKPLTRYELLYEITAQQIAFASGVDNVYHGALEFDIAVYDADAKLVTSLGQTVKMPLDDFGYQQFMQQPFRFRQQIDLPAGQLFVRVGVLDHTSNKVGTLEIPLKVEKGLDIKKPDAAKGTPGETSHP